MRPAHRIRSRRRTRLLLPLILVMVLLGLDQPSIAAQPPADTGRPRVMIVSVPRLTWDHLIDEQPPNLTAFLGEARWAT